MSQSLASNYIHIIFSTKHRQPLITESIQNELFHYLGGTCNEMGCQSISVGGYLDHVHILCALSKKIALMKLLQEVKSNSSGWIKTRGREFEEFFWQDGYGAFSVGYKDLEKVTDYISNQKEHHQKMGFQEEFRIALKRTISNTMKFMYGTEIINYE